MELLLRPVQMYSGESGLSGEGISAADDHRDRRNHLDAATGRIITKGTMESHCGGLGAKWDINSEAHTPPVRKKGSQEEQDGAVGAVESIAAVPRDESCRC